MEKELPPRARRILAQDLKLPILGGTTSACAENTYMKKSMIRRMWNYLRVRGEYSIPSTIARANMELPPRARRIPSDKTAYSADEGTTSACAENTR